MFVFRFAPTPALNNILFLKFQSTPTFISLFVDNSPDKNNLLLSLYFIIVFSIIESFDSITAEKSNNSPVVVIFAKPLLLLLIIG